MQIKKNIRNIVITGLFITGSIAMGLNGRDSYHGVKRTQLFSNEISQKNITMIENHIRVGVLSGRLPFFPDVTKEEKKIIGLAYFNVYWDMGSRELSGDMYKKIRTKAIEKGLQVNEIIYE